ncbi:DNA replication/repair protein RecF [Clostridiisalibacter paucivorans]|uniref:DNA replication/repair protein RecF n=1 Tax=Clostridiisalibacter paucivorans TaxID=408753 RepID=UPI00047ACC3C|nr:DNA replication/repair protein RecF [Clostridiisalibacter paucivorans]
MFVKKIKLINFRNYNSVDVEIGKGLNIFFGENAQGKTNLLESVFIGSTGKSFRTNKDNELINLNKDKGYIGLNIQKDSQDKLVEIKLDKNKKKRVKINRVELDKVSEMAGFLQVVIFSPEDLKIIKEGPSERRRFLNDEISQIKPLYRHNLTKYRKILNQRNNLLKQILQNKQKKYIIEVWDEQLSKIASEIMYNRIVFINRLSIISRVIHEKLTGKREDLKIRYIPSININDIKNREEIEEIYIKALKENFKRDIEKMSTQYGPHRDNMGIFINDTDSRVFGSQGQQRTAALSLKLAEIQIIHEEFGEYPVLLLDDVLSELDVSRRNFLVSTFKNIQTILTTTDDVNLKELNIENYKRFRISKGNIIKEG